MLDRETMLLYVKVYKQLLKLTESRPELNERIKKAYADTIAALKENEPKEEKEDPYEFALKIFDGNL